jgi:hypothetical protein
MTPRMLDSDVRAIFKCIYDKTPPPAHLNFKVVPVGPKGLPLSPPPIEFEGETVRRVDENMLFSTFSCFPPFPPTDGIYVLLRPNVKQKKGSIVDPPKVPTHLAHLVLQDIPPDACPWSLSGPQFPRTTATGIQQRYCYPQKGARRQYSCCKGSSLWTMYRDGVEDENYRLLHVYFSTKRAKNSGVAVPDEEASSYRSSVRSRAPKRSKIITSPPRNIYPVNNRASFFASPTMTAVSTTSPSLHDSPLRFDDLSPPSLGNSHFVVTPNSDPFRRCEHSDEVSMLNPSPFRPKLPVAQHNFPSSPLSRRAFNDDDSDSFLFDTSITTSWHEIDESLWNDPLLDIMLKPSQDHGIDRLQVSSSSSSLSPLTSKQDTSEHTQSFSAQLETLKHTLQERILTAPVEEHSALMTQLVTWASALAQDPFSETLLPEASAGEDAKDDNGSQITRESHEDDSKCSWVHSTLV